jgi:hypothetical protein
MGGATPPLPQYAFVAWCSVKAQGQLYLYLYLLDLDVYNTKTGHLRDLSSQSVLYPGHLNEILYDCVHRNCPLSGREFKRADKIHVRHRQAGKSGTVGRQLLPVQCALNVTISMSNITQGHPRAC